MRGAFGRRHYYERTTLINVKIRFWFLTRARVAFADQHNNRLSTVHFVHTLARFHLYISRHAATDGHIIYKVWLERNCIMNEVVKMCIS